MRGMDFFRLRSVNVSYRLPDGMIPGTNAATLTLSGANLLTLTEYWGNDPESRILILNFPSVDYHSHARVQDLLSVAEHNVLTGTGARIVKTYEKTRMRAAVAGLVVAVFGASGCGDLLEVTNAGLIEDESLNDPNFAPAIVAGDVGGLFAGVEPWDRAVRLCIGLRD